MRLLIALLMTGAVGRVARRCARPVDAAVRRLPRRPARLDARRATADQSRRDNEEYDVLRHAPKKRRYVAQSFLCCGDAVPPGVSGWSLRSDIGVR